MKTIACCTAVALMVSTVPAQTAKPVPRLPTFRYPVQAVQQTPWPVHAWPVHAWPAHAWPAWLRAQINKELPCGGCGDVTVMHVNLGQLGPGALVTRFKDEGGQGGNDYTFYLVYRWHNRYVTNQFAGPGASHGQVVMGTGAVPDLISTEDFPCCSANATRYTFHDGTWTESGCDSLLFGGALWDVKDMQIRNCYDPQ